MENCFIIGCDIKKYKILQYLIFFHINKKASTPINKLLFSSVACKYKSASFWDTLIEDKYFGFVAMSSHLNKFLSVIDLSNDIVQI